jgi:pyruvate kinase
MIMNKTKIVATIGPASADKNILKEMFYAGVNVCRINFSHSSHEEAAEIVATVRELNQEINAHVAILADLQGPKLRIGEVEKGAVIHIGDTLTFTNQPCLGNAKRVYMSYDEFPNDVKPGERVMLDDGKLVVEIISTDAKSEVIGKVIQGGPLKSNKGVNLPNTKVTLPCLTEKDLADLDKAIELEVEWIGLSFVRAVEDVVALRKVIDANGSPARIISKIEKPEAVADIDAIIDATDGIMVARGDLGVEIPMQEVPVLQKKLVEKCRMKAKPVIIATQMMESMIENMSPTRAEVNDVANSVLDGADAVMLSGETSVGAYPLQVIEAMSKIIEEVEKTGKTYFEDYRPLKQSDRYVSDTVCYNSATIADQIGAKAIITMTHSGYTGFRISSHRPSCPVFVFTHNKRLLNALNLLRGVEVFFYDRFESTDNTMKEIKQILFDSKRVVKGDLVINIASMPITDKGMTNMLKISEI